MVREQFVERSVEDVLDEIFNRTEIGEALKDAPQHVLEYHYYLLLIIIIYFKNRTHTKL